MGFLDIVITIVSGLLMLTLLVVAHEAGHFFVGRACNIRIEEFAVGFGPKLLTKVKKGIRYSIRALPLGGFVQFYGEDEEIENEPRAFNNRPIWQRFVTLIAGPFMNVVVAFLVAALVFLIFGDYTPVVYEIPAEYAEQVTELEQGDRIVEINGRKIEFYDQFGQIYTSAMTGDSMTLGVLRDGQVLQVEVPIKTTTDSESGKITKQLSVELAISRTHFGFFESIAMGFKWLIFMIGQIFSTLYLLIFKGQGLENVGSFIEIINLVGQAVRLGPEWVLRIASMLSINLGIMNILPFPALDGGRMVFLGIEKLRGKPIPRKVEGIVNLVGLAILFVLIIILTGNDIARMIARGA